MANIPLGPQLIAAQPAGSCSFTKAGILGTRDACLSKKRDGGTRSWISAFSSSLLAPALTNAPLTWSPGPPPSPSPNSYKLLVG